LKTIKAKKRLKTISSTESTINTPRGVRSSHKTAGVAGNMPAESLTQICGGINLAEFSF
jgi:hypothetical protein